jgi:hypothetical protein
MKMVDDKMNREAEKILESYEIPPEVMDKNGHIRILVDVGGMTRNRLKMLSLISLPQSKNMKVVEKCKVCGISTQGWYLAFKDSAFCDAVKTVSRRNIAMGYVPNALHGLALQADSGDTSASRLILQTAELLGDKRLGGNGPKGSSDTPSQTVNVVVNQDGTETKTEDDLIGEAIRELELRGYRVTKRNNNRLENTECP